MNLRQMTGRGKPGPAGGGEAEADNTAMCMTALVEGVAEDVRATAGQEAGATFMQLPHHAVTVLAQIGQPDISVSFDSRQAAVNIGQLSQDVCVTLALE